MHEGIIKIIERSKGYGLIELPDGELIFFHQRWLRKIRFRDLRVGDEVAFTIVRGPRGPRASIIGRVGDITQIDQKSDRLAAIFRD